MARAFPNARISRIHGRPRKINGILYYPMYHPAAALHQGSLRQAIEADMLKIPSFLGEAGGVEEAKQEPEQLSMF